ncbi:MAG TPA: hypothetical protein VHC22_29800 [Pirellulales bacterium]|nr:hypothetical protein [Pirellulales bacterium]
MAIRFLCPLGHRLKVPDERAGKNGRCPVCQQRLIVPQLSIPSEKSEAACEPVAEERSSCREPLLEVIDESSSSIAAVVCEPDSKIGGLCAGPAPPETPARALTTIDQTTTPNVPQQAEDIGGERATAVGPAEPLAIVVPPLAPPPEPEEFLIPPPPGNEPTPRSALAPLPEKAVAAPCPPPLPVGTTVSSPREVPASSAPQATGSTTAIRRVQWCTWARGDDLTSFDVYRPGPRQLEFAYWIACLLPFVAVFCAAPALPHLQFSDAPSWAQALLCIAAVELGYAAWLAMVPDWSIVRIGMFLFGGVAALFAGSMFACLLSSQAQWMSLAMAELRATAATWCGLSAVVSACAFAACRWLDRVWRAASI